MIEEPEVRFAKGTDLKQAIAIGFDECLTALTESFYDLDDERAWAFPLPGRNNIAWIVMHSLMNLDEYGPYTLGYLTYGGDGDHRRWAIDWRKYGGQFETSSSPAKPGDSFPTVQQMLQTHQKVRVLLDEVLGGLTSEDLLRPIRDWWPHAADSCMRTIWHTAAHVRQIWLLRGMLGWAEGQSWPDQHWA